MGACYEQENNGGLQPDKLRKLREQRAFNQEALASASKLSVRTIQRAERGEKIDLKTILELARALGVDPEELTEQAPDPEAAGRELSAREANLIRSDPSGRHFFAGRFAHEFPGVRETVWFNQPEYIEERMNRLLLPIPSEPHAALWWLRGGSNMYIDAFRKIQPDRFLLNEKELNISRIAAVYSPSEWRCFLYVECEGLETTGLYDKYPGSQERALERFCYHSEEYGYFDGKCVTRQEYDDGAAVLDGKLVGLPSTVSLRARYTTPYNFIIAANGHVANNYKNDTQTEEILNNILKGNKTLDNLSDAINRFS